MLGEAPRDGRPLCHLAEPTETVTMCSQYVLAWKHAAVSMNTPASVNEFMPCVPAQSKS